MAPDPTIKATIETTITRGISSNDFGLRMSDIVHDVITQMRLGTLSPESAQDTSAYLFSHVSRTLLENSSRTLLAEYGERMARLLRVVGSYYAGPLRNTARSMFVNLAASLYSLHAAFVIAGRDSYSFREPLNCLAEFIESLVAPANSVLHYVTDAPNAGAPPARARVVDLDAMGLPTANPAAAVNSQIYLGANQYRINLEPNLRVNSWNMQGRTSGAQDKWNEIIKQSLLSNNAILVLQEIGDQLPDFETVQPGFVQVPDQHGNINNVETYRWNTGSTDRPEYFLVYVLRTGSKNLAIVLRDPDLTPHAHGSRPYRVTGISVISDISPSRRGVLGLRISGGELAEDVTVLSIHAASPGGPNNPTLLRDVARFISTPFVLMGDFNQEPGENWVSPPGLAQVVEPDGPTRESRELDYLVVDGIYADPVQAERSTVQSDHVAILAALVFASIQMSR